jgi:6-pyruvoyltetrahydropterin/6-carboxytetrahydropterin synthase
MKTKISKVFYFDAAHRIANHKGKCKNLHGHTYKLIVTVEGEIESGMVIDFEDLKKIVDPVIKKYDHSYLNDFFENPTVENIAIKILSEIQKKTDKIVSVKLWEGRNNYAEVLP